jgi:hypothetical protein
MTGNVLLRALLFATAPIWLPLCAVALVVVAIAGGVWLAAGHIVNPPPRFVSGKRGPIGQTVALVPVPGGE